jgi:hypothetical protein
MESGCTEDVAGLMTVTWAMTICLCVDFVLGSVCARVAGANESASERSTRMRSDGEIMRERLLRSVASDEP